MGTSSDETPDRIEDPDRPGVLVPGGRWHLNLTVQEAVRSSRSRPSPPWPRAIRWSWPERWSRSATPSRG